MVDGFKRFRLKRYKHFDLFLHKNQFPYIGRCYAWALREDAKELTDMNNEERDELFELIIPSWDESIFVLYEHDRNNVAFFGNDARHLHAHLIPRYDSSRKRHGVEFTDPNPKGNYSPYPFSEIEDEILMKIRDEIRETLK